MVLLLSPCYHTQLLNRQEDPFTEIVVYTTILALVTSAETVPPLATALTTVVDCAYDGRRLRLRRSATALTTIGDCAYDGRHAKNGRVERCKSGKVMEAAADGHEKEI